MPLSMPSNEMPMIRPAQSASGPGDASTARQLVKTAVSTSLGRSINSGKATTLEANTGAASTPPSSNQASNTQPWSCSTTWRKKSSGRSTGNSEKLVTIDAEVSTQPVPASPSSSPKCTSRGSWPRHNRNTSCIEARSPRSSVRLTAYSPVARMGATIKKPLKAPARIQKCSWAHSTRVSPKVLASKPCSKPGQGHRHRSA